MNTVGYTPAYGANLKNNNVKQQSTAPAFKGAIGDKFVKEIESGKNVDVAEIVKAVKGTFGASSEKVADVVESLLAKISEMKYSNQNLKNQVEEKSQQVLNERAKNEEMASSIRDIREHFKGVISSKDKELVAKDKEVKEAKEFAAKYEPMARVKSVDEIGSVLPKEAIETLKAMSEHKTESLDSMYEFLTTGKGQEKALEQVERFTKVIKARNDKALDVPEVSEAFEETKKNIGYCVDYNHRPGFVLGMINDSLAGNVNGVSVAMPSVREQVQTNALALLAPLSDSPEQLKWVKEYLNGILKGVGEYQTGYANGIKKFTNQGWKISGEPVKYEFKEKSITASHNEYGTRELSPDDLYVFGAS